jgi:pyruvate dehydrogenase E1 component alpha subunit
MHISVPDTGFMTATGVVGGNIPLALGAALSAKLDSNNQVALALFGDGTGQTGTFHESLNIASLWQLPVIFICENNGYAEFTPLSSHTNIERLSQHADTYGIPKVVVDGNDVAAIRSAMNEAIERARGGGGPSFIEALTYRLRGHYEGDPDKYRELSERDDWKAKDPLARYIEKLTEDGVISDDSGESEAAEQKARELIDTAAAFALESDWPPVSAVTDDVYAG